MSKAATLLALLTPSALAGKCPFGYGGDSDEAPVLAQNSTVLDIKYPGDYFKCPT